LCTTSGFTLNADSKVLIQVVYLESPEEGGETFFTRLGVCSAPWIPSIGHDKCLEPKSKKNHPPRQRGTRGCLDIQNHDIFATFLFFRIYPDVFHNVLVY
jgi:hypothetical protein